MDVVEALRGIMDGFDPFYGSTVGEETDEARRKALAAAAGSKEYADPARGRDVITKKPIDGIFSVAKGEIPSPWRRRGTYCSASLGRTAPRSTAR